MLLTASILGAWASLGWGVPRFVDAIAIGMAFTALILRLTHQQQVSAVLRQDLSTARNQLDHLVGRLTDQVNSLDELSDTLAELTDSVAGLTDAARRTETVTDKLSRDLISRTWANTELAREGLRLVRQEVGELSSRIRPDANRRTPVPAVSVDPIVSIAIPGFNRPEQLEQCLASIAEEVERTGTDRVEVWVTDDQSTFESAIDIAEQFAERFPFIGFRINDENLGLERNLLEACQPCRGEYVWIIGNDDRLRPGALDVVLQDVQDHDVDLFVYGKVRVDTRGVVIDIPARGAVPDDAVDGETRTYDSALGFARSTGIISGFGFISTVVVRRAPFVAVSSTPYMGLTMYPQVGRLLESVGARPMLFNNTAVVFQRTTARAEKLAEAVGRPEEEFMAGGAERDLRWFGATLAALLGRVCERSVLRPKDFIGIPEFLFGQDSLVAWIENNMEIARQQGFRLSTDIEEDAARFLQAARSA